MTSTEVKSEEKDDAIIGEEAVVFHHTIEQMLPSTSEKRKRDEEIPSESPNKYKQISVGHRSLSTTAKKNFLTVPFWKELNTKQTSVEYHPKEVGSFSLLMEGDRQECFEDKRYRRVYKYPLETRNVNLDLKIGLSDFVYDGQSKNLDGMLWWISKHKEEIFKNNQFTFDFLSWRGALRSIMFSFYEKRSDWLLAVIKYRNAYFLCEYGTDMQLKEEQNMTSKDHSFCYYGLKFEEYVTKNDGTTKTLNSSEKFTGVFQSTIGSYRLLYGAEIDCVVEKSSSTTEHIELKVCAGNSINDLPFHYNHKYAKWWIQSFLAGIQTMIIGFRDDNGIVNKLLPLNISRIESATSTWSRQAFFNLFTLFAKFVKDNVTNEYSIDQKEVFLFSFSSSSRRITVEKSSDPKYRFIPDQFFHEFN
jgi:RAT1-interacting protein